MTGRPCRSILGPLALLAMALLLTACAARTPGTTATRTVDMTPDARISYDYLVYQDQLGKLQRHYAEGDASPLSPAEVAELKGQALKSLDRLIESVPSPQLYLEKASLVWDEEDGPARSRAILKQGLALFPDDQMLTIYLANTYIIENRTDAAISVMDDYLARNPEDLQAKERLGQLLMDAGQDAQALDILKQIPAAKRSADTLYAIGRVQGNLGMRSAAIANLKKAVAMDARFTEAMVELAYQYELAKDYVLAEKMYTRILNQGDPFPEARLRLVNLNLKLNNPARALEMTLSGPPSKSFIMDSVLMFINEGFYAQGSTALDMLTTGGEIPAEYYFYKAVIANEGENDPEKALSYLSKVEEKDRLYPHALRFKAQLMNLMGRPGEALERARTGKELYPESPIFYILESSLLKTMGLNTDAEAVLLDGLTRLEGNPELSYDLAMLYEEMDRRSEGMAIMEEIIRANPDYTNGLNYVGYTLAEEGRELDRALVLVEKASQLDPENGYILDSVAWVYFKMGDLTKAWENITYATDQVDNDPTVWEHYGDIAQAMGKTKEARRGYKNALKYGTKNAAQVRSKLNTL